MILEPRINLKSIPYSYLGATIDTSVETDVGQALADFANYALALEQAAEEFGFKPTPTERPMAREIVQRGGEIINDGERNDTSSAPSTPRSNGNGGPACAACGGPTEWTGWKKSKNGGSDFRFPECAGTCKNENGYALSGKPQFAGGR